MMQRVELNYLPLEYSMLSLTQTIKNLHLQKRNSATLPNISFYHVFFSYVRCKIDTIFNKISTSTTSSETKTQIPVELDYDNGSMKTLLVVFPDLDGAYSNKHFHGICSSETAITKQAG